MTRDDLIDLLSQLTGETPELLASDVIAGPEWAKRGAGAPDATKRAWNNRVRRHLDLLTRCPRCDNQELPCPRPEVKIIQTTDDDQYLVKYRWFNVPTKKPATPWIYLIHNGEPARLPSKALPAFNNWSTTWDALHVEP